MNILKQKTKNSSYPFFAGICTLYEYFDFVFDCRPPPRLSQTTNWKVFVQIDLCFCFL